MQQSSLLVRTPSPHDTMNGDSSASSTSLGLQIRQLLDSSALSEATAPLDLSLNLRNSPIPHASSSSLLSTQLKAKKVVRSRAGIIPRKIELARKRRLSSMTTSLIATTSASATNPVTQLVHRPTLTNNLSATGLLRTQQPQLGISGVSLSSLSPASSPATSSSSPAPISPNLLDANKSSILDSPPNSDQDQEMMTVASQAFSASISASTTALRMLGINKPSSGVLEPEIILSTDPMDDEPVQGGGSPQKRRLDAMVNGNLLPMQALAFSGNESNDAAAASVLLTAASFPSMTMATSVPVTASSMLAAVTAASLLSNTTSSVSNNLNSSSSSSSLKNHCCQFGQLSLHSPHVDNVSSGHLIVAPTTSRSSNKSSNVKASRPSPMSGTSLLRDNSFPSSSSALANVLGTLSSANIALLSPNFGEPLPSTSAGFAQNGNSLNSFHNTSNENSSDMLEDGNENQSEDKPIIFPCELCDQLFEAPDRLNKHIASRHRHDCKPLSAKAMQEKGFFCHICCRGFSRSDMLTRHFRLHSGVKPYTCDICAQVFSRSDHLATHKRTHSGEKPYKCQYCSYSACRRDMITRHQKTHLNDDKKKQTSNRMAAANRIRKSTTASVVGRNVTRTVTGAVNSSTLDLAATLDTLTSLANSLKAMSSSTANSSISAVDQTLTEDAGADSSAKTMKKSKKST